MEPYDALVLPVARFVAELTPAVAELAARAARDATPADGLADRLEDDVWGEAATLVAACIDADTVHTDAELWSYLRAFGPRLEGDLHRATPDQLRLSGLVAGRRSALDRTTALFDLLVDADAADGGTRSWRYFRAAMDLAHTVASLDVHTSQAELDAIGRFRAVLLERITRAGVPRPDADFFGVPPAALDGAARRGAAPGAPEAPARPTDTPAADGTGVEEAAAAEGVTEPEPLPPARPVEEVLADLDGLIGLAPVKAEVKLVTNLLIVQKLRHERGLPVVDTSRHLVFTGNPGTGKTTVARLLAEIYRSLGVVTRGHLVETDRSGLVAGFVGQTATRTREMCESALDGLLVIDEAHALARGSEQDFGREAIDTLVKVMEDERDRLVVIVAGYPDEMAMFMAANPGLSSRFPKTIHFPDYDADELTAIFRLLADKHHYVLDSDLETALADYFTVLPRERGFGNGRFARNLFEASVARQASRLVEIEDPTDDELTTLVAADVLG